jgi:hypothetical protein
MNKGLAAIVLAAALLPGCGGGGGSTGATGATGGSITCSTAHYTAGAVSIPTAGDMATYAKTYNGNTGTFNVGAFTSDGGTAAFVLGASGSLTYNGTAQTVDSICKDSTLPMIYVEFGSTGAVDFMADGTFTGNLADASLTGVQSTVAAGAATPTVTGFTPATGAVGTTVTISGTDLGNFTPAATVKFGSTAATVSSATSTAITVTVPHTLATGNSTITLSNSDGTGVVTVGTFSVTAAASVPATPTGVSAATISSSQINLSWSAVSGAAAYYVYRATTAGLAVTSMTNVTSGSAMVGPSTVATSLNDTYALSAGTTYYYKVVALNAVGASVASSEVNATTSAAGGAVVFPNEAITLPSMDLNAISNPTMATTDVSSMVGTYTGTKSAYQTNVDTSQVVDYSTAVTGNSCQLTFTANRTLTLTDGTHTFTQTANDSWTHSLTGEANTGWYNAGSQSLGVGATGISMQIGRGKLIAVTAQVFTGAPAVMSEKLTCWMPVNRTVGTAGGNMTAGTYYDNASDMPATAPGTYNSTLQAALGAAAPMGSTCQLLVAADGVMTFTTTGLATNANIAVQVAGDYDDRVTYTNATTWSYTGKDISDQISGAYNSIQIQDIAGTLIMTVSSGTVRPLTTASYTCM